MRKISKFTTLLIIFVMLFSFTGCYFKSPDTEKYEKALTNVMEAKANEYSSVSYTSDVAPFTGCVRTISYYGHGVQSIYFEFDNSTNAYNFFDKYGENFEDLFQGDYYRGEYKKSSSGSRGYVYMDGTISVDASTMSMFGTGETFGGAYYEGKVVVITISHSGASSNVYVTDFLKSLGYPIFDA